MKEIPIRIVDSIASRLGYKRPEKAYQETRFPEDQYALISSSPPYNRIKNTLEIGCNLGLLGKAISMDGKFSIGVDIRNHWLCRETGNVVLGVYPIDLDSVDKLPDVDAFLLLSVHHQWVKSMGDEYAKQLLMRIYEKSKICMYVEFSALARKYGYAEGVHFQDNDQESVVEYAGKWLSECGIDKWKLLGKSRELGSTEPYRYMFLLSR